MASTRATAKAQMKEIVKYILTTIGFEIETIEKMTGEKVKLDTIKRIKNANQDLLIKGDVITVGEYIDILQLQRWLDVYTASGEKTLPDSLDTWKEVFTYDTFSSQTKNKTTSTFAIPPSGVTTPNITSKKPTYVSVKIGDYPTFTGRHQDWYAFRSKCESLARIHGFTDVLDISDIDHHTENRHNDTEYDLRVRDFYSILEFCTTDGTAATTVKQHSATCNGAVAWKSLKDYYDQDGNKDIYEVQCRRKLAQLTLESSTPGGFAKYQNDFGTICQHIEECGTLLSDREKRAHFLGGIHDPDYSTIKDICEGVPFNSAITKLARKAAELGKQNGPARRHFKKVTRKIRESKPANTRTQFRRTNANKSNSSNFLPKNVWEQMFPEAS